MSHSIVQCLTISDLWDCAQVEIPFHPDVNILFGKNGTGKTTAISLLNAALSSDIRTLRRHPFSRITVKLTEHEGLLVVDKARDERGRTTSLHYTLCDGQEIDLVSSRSHIGPHRVEHDHRIALSPLAAERLSRQLSELVRTRWVPADRYRGERRTRAKDDEAWVPPLDQKLEMLSSETRDYLFSKKIIEMEQAKKFQHSAILETLWDKTRGMPELENIVASDLDEQKSNLEHALTDLGLPGWQLAGLLDSHFDSVKEVVQRVSPGLDEIDAEDFLICAQHDRALRIIELAERMRRDQAAVYRQRDRFLELCGEFFETKQLQLSEMGEIECTMRVKGRQSGRRLGHESLSSGEKQLLITLLETLLQDSQPHVFMIDEPEISLHVEWQERLVSAMRELNPACQLILATHSPDIISDYGEQMIEMEDHLYVG